jgi:hypothetical protein
MNPKDRTISHKSQSSWFDTVASISIERHCTIDDARRAEAEAIFKENPKYNKHRPDLDYDSSIEAVIRGAGGLEALVNLLGLHPRRGYALVAQWRHRGAIPPKHVVCHHELFRRLERKGKKA